MARGKAQGNTHKKWSLTKRVRKFGFRAKSDIVLKYRRLKKRKSLSASEGIATTKAAKNKKFRRRR